MLSEREEIHLRLLGHNGKIDQDDYLEAKYLVDKGYVNGKYRISKQKGSYGQILNFLWDGLTVDGMDYLETLKLKKTEPPVQRQAAEINQQCGNDGLSETPKIPHSLAKLWHERSGFNYLLMEVAIFVAGTAAVALLTWLIHFIFS